MKKNLVSLLLLSTVLSSCEFGGGGGNTIDGDLSIIYFNGGYGSAWMNNLVKRFEAKYNVKVNVKASDEADCGADASIKSGTSLRDIYIAEGVNWKALVDEKKLADLSSVYNEKVETSNGLVSIKDFMRQDIVGNFYSQTSLYNTTFKPYAMPWTAKTNAMAYNVDALTQVQHVSPLPVSNGVIGGNGKWIAPPVTRDDLLAFCEDVKAFSPNGEYVAIGWCGTNNADSISFLVNNWWAELQGLKVSNYQNEGSYYDFFNYGNTGTYLGQNYDLSVFNQTGLKEAFNLVCDLLFVDNGFKNSISDPYNTDLQELQRLFAWKESAQKPILTIASSYLENEVIKNQCWSRDDAEDIEFKFMNVPKLNAESEDLLNLNYSDSIVVPAASKHIDLAKKFLVFMSSEEEIINFAKDTSGGIRPFNCDVTKDAKEGDYSTFATSLFEVYNNSTKFCEYPLNTIVDNDPVSDASLSKVSHLFRYENLSYAGNRSWLQIVDKLKSHDAATPVGKQIMDEIVYNLKKDNEEAWNIDYFEED